jgi:hypothetical protein
VKLAEALDWNSGDVTVRVVEGVLGFVPFAPGWTHRDPREGLDPRVVERAEALAAAAEPQAALRAFNLLDKADSGIAIFSGLRAGVKAARGEEGALEMDPQQAADAGVKALGVSYAAWKIHGGDPRKLLESQAGQALLAWYVVCDLVLPFADNAASGGAELAGRLFDQHAADATALAAVAPDAAEAVGALASLRSTIGGWAAQAATLAKPVGAWLGERLPGWLGTADKVTGVVATGVDALGAYRYLGGALVAEVLLARAKGEIDAEDAAKAAAEAEAARRAAEAEQARRDAEEAEAAARLARSAQQAAYDPAAAVPAASARNVAIQYTRTTDEAPVAKRGCLGCMSVVLLAVLVGGAAIGMVG